MRVKTGSGVSEYRTVWMEGSEVKMIDQTVLPKDFRIHSSLCFAETVSAIRNMVVRGSPAIGAAAAYAVTQAVFEFKGADVGHLKEHIAGAAKTLRATRPTAYDLFHAVSFMESKIEKVISVGEARQVAVEFGRKYADESAERCRLIGEAGEALIKDGGRILTHCNAGALGCVDYGTALAPIRLAHSKGKKVFVLVDETRPRLQGAKLTAWELSHEDISHRVIADNAAGYYMSIGEVDMVIVGADRITKNGDVINKIGTYEKAVVAKENCIPFYVAAPTTSFDDATESAASVEIESRSEDEVLSIDGVRIACPGSHAFNPGFDVTPKKYVTGIITEKGIK